MQHMFTTLQIPPWILIVLGIYWTWETDSHQNETSDDTTEMKSDLIKGTLEIHLDQTSSDSLIYSKKP